MQDEAQHQEKANHIVNTVLERLDLNHDGQVTPEELEKVGLGGLPNFHDLGAEGHHYDVESGEYRILQCILGSILITAVEFFLHHEGNLYNRKSRTRATDDCYEQNNTTRRRKLKQTMHTTTLRISSTFPSTRPLSAKKLNGKRSTKASLSKKLSKLNKLSHPRLLSNPLVVLRSRLTILIPTQPTHMTTNQYTSHQFKNLLQLKSLV